MTKSALLLMFAMALSTTVQSAESDQCRIAWENRLTGATGHSGYMSKATAEAWLQKATAEYGHVLDHWLECK